MRRPQWNWWLVALCGLTGLAFSWWGHHLIRFLLEIVGWILFFTTWGFLKSFVRNLRRNRKARS